VISYALALLLPIGGLIAGLLLLGKRATFHGVAVLLISAAIVSTALISAGGSHPSGIPHSIERSAHRQAQRMIDCVDGSSHGKRAGRAVNHCVRARR
jgi:hypothetical protein